MVPQSLNFDAAGYAAATGIPSVYGPFLPDGARSVPACVSEPLRSPCRTPAPSAAPLVRGKRKSVGDLGGLERRARVDAGAAEDSAPGSGVEDQGVCPCARCGGVCVSSRALPSGDRGGNSCMGSRLACVCSFSATDLRGGAPGDGVGEEHPGGTAEQDQISAVSADTHQTEATRLLMLRWRMPGELGSCAQWLLLAEESVPSRVPRGVNAVDGALP
jgi:hypothetical protein